MSIVDSAIKMVILFGVTGVAIVALLVVCAARIIFAR